MKLSIGKTNRPSVDFLVVGLGNYGKKYANTRHNAGFMAAEYICKKLGIESGKMRWDGEIFTTNVNQKKIIIAKPHTYMNRSGECVVRISKYFDIAPEKIIVIYDDMELDTGKLRIRAKGSDGGHNGIKSIINFMGSYNIPRIRIGISKIDNPDYDAAKWVLGDFRTSERKLIDESLQNVYDAVMLMIEGNINEAMNRYNGSSAANGTND